MKPSATQQARARRDKAAKAVSGMETAKTYAEFNQHWIDFLLAMNGVYTKLAAGSLGSPKSQGWFGRKKHERKTDPLLSYIHHARNADEHGVEDSTVLRPGKFWAGRGAESLSVSMANGIMDIRSGDGRPFTVGISSATAELVSVRDDRFGDQFDPPNHHLGLEINDPSPVGVAKLALSFADKLISEAEAL
jgi:hypothetical protein